MSESQTAGRRSTRSSKRKTSPIPAQPSRDSSESTSPPPPKKARTAAKSTDEGGLPLPHSITPDVFRQHLERYPSCVPDKLHKLDEARYDTIPAAVRSRQRRTSKGDPAVDTSGGAGADAGAASDHEEDEEEDEEYGYLTKEEVVQLVEWKLKHGTFRPALLGMARAHPPDAIRKTTSLAFQQLLSTSTSTTESKVAAAASSGAAAAMKTLCTLRGIGPATASLLLSCANTSAVPFFSDELYRWMMWDSADTPGKGSGWTRKIGYTDKEYTALREAVGRTLERMKGEEWDEVGAMDLEKVAYVLGKGDS